MPSACDDCKDGNCPAKQKKPGETDEALEERRRIAARLCRIKRRIMILSGKGGVGKSTVAVSLALSLAEQGKSVGLLDVDIHGPSVPVLLGLSGTNLISSEGGIEPALFEKKMKVISIGFMLQERDAPVIWRGPLKYSAIKQFIGDVNWGDLDYLVVDAPPGTGDEPLSVAQILEGADGAVIVTTPQEVALSDVRRCVNFCRRLSLPVIGVVENMSGFVCPHCGRESDIFGRGGGEQMAREMDVKFLGSIPLEAGLAAMGDAGRPFVTAAPESVSAVRMKDIARKTVEQVEDTGRVSSD